MNINLPSYASDLLDPARYKVLLGGRGSAKSYTVARMLLLKGAQRKCRVLCAREFQNSITESVHKLLVEQAEEMGLSGFYKHNATSVWGANGTEFIFKGVRLNVQSIKSMVGVTDLWLEEAHTISQASWDVLIPTIREPNSEIWVTFNPDSEDDPTYTMFVDKNGRIRKRSDAIIRKVNWNDNPWFPEVLAKEKDHLFSVNPDLAMHVWEGYCRTHSDAQIFKGKWEVRAFEPEAYKDRHGNSTLEGPYYGADHGFSTDPATLVRMFIDPDRRELLIRNAIFGYHIELDNLPRFYDQVPGARDYTIRADNARPETISYVSRQGFDMIPADKWKGSVEDGIEFLKSFSKIVIHPDCGDMITEAKNYSYKVDRLTGDVLTVIVDAYNHGWDGCRYGLAPMITAESSILDVL